MNSDADVFDVDWDEDHKEKSSENYNPYAHVFDSYLVGFDDSEILEDFDWERDD